MRSWEVKPGVPAARVPRVATVETPAGLGSALRAARQAKSLSLSEVTAATGISSSFLSLVENGKSDITIGRLVRLVTFYGIHLADLVPVAPAAEPDLVRKSEQRTLPSPAEGIQFRLLAPSVQGVMMPMILEFEPGAHLAEYGRHAGEEFVHVLRGSMELELEGSEPRVLRAGDSAYYSAERPHLFRNASDTQPLRVICVDSPPNL
jgi:quercetin dioxygenase-like cupin family protein